MSLVGLHLSPARETAPFCVPIVPFVKFLHLAPARETARPPAALAAAILFLHLSPARETALKKQESDSANWLPEADLAR